MPNNFFIRYYVRIKLDANLVVGIRHLMVIQSRRFAGLRRIHRQSHFVVGLELQRLTSVLKIGLKNHFKISQGVWRKLFYLVLVVMMKDIHRLKSHRSYCLHYYLRSRHQSCFAVVVVVVHRMSLMELRRFISNLQISIHNIDDATNDFSLP